MIAGVISRRWFQGVCQAVALLVINGHYNFFKSLTLYQGKLKNVCFPVLNCHSCPLALYTIYKDMVLISGSQFFMGSDNKGKLTSSKQTIVVDSFYMDIYPVTNSEYSKVVTDWKFDPEKGHHPLVGLRYDEIMEYCRLVGKRLPTEAEWEKAARGDRDKRLYPWGTAFSSKKCNCRKVLFLMREKVTPVDAYREGRSPYGCFDMAGNVWEWTSTSVSGESYILKGGSCTSPSKRHLIIPSRLIANKNCINHNFGFRCCLSV